MPNYNPLDEHEDAGQSAGEPHDHGHEHCDHAEEVTFNEVFGMSTEDIRKDISESARRLRKEEEKIPGFFTESFGPWEFDSEDYLLIHKKAEYIIPLERITSSACILDWIFQVQGKPWADLIDVYTLLVALRRILDPQANYCSFEEDRRTEGAELAKAYAEKVEEHREETESIQRFQDISKEVLKMLSIADKPLPLSLIIETLEYTREDIMDTIIKLDKMNGILYNRDTKYIELTPEFVTALQAAADELDEPCDCPEHQHLFAKNKKGDGDASHGDESTI